MGQKSQYQIGRKQRIKRKKARKQLVAKGRNVDEFYYGRYFIKLGE